MEKTANSVDFFLQHLKSQMCIINNYDAFELFGG